MATVVSSHVFGQSCLEHLCMLFHGIVVVEINASSNMILEKGITDDGLEMSVNENLNWYCNV